MVNLVARVFVTWTISIDSTASRVLMVWSKKSLLISADHSRTEVCAEGGTTIGRLPFREVMRPSSRKRLSASRIVWRLTSKRSHSSSSVGIRDPTG
jgi:hypothetical protein